MTEQQTAILKFIGEYRFLSNFYASPVSYFGEEYPTAEHAYQAQKTTDSDQRAFIRGMETPGKAKRAGSRRGGTVLRSDWESIKFFTMQQIVAQKFSNNPDIREKLVATGNMRLEEGNSWNDTYWGVCKGKGENHLGKILMRVRKFWTP